MDVNPIFVKLIKHSAKNKNHPIGTKNNNRKEKYILEPNYLSGDKLSIWGICLHMWQLIGYVQRIPFNNGQKNI